jgi:putative endonuclease
MTNKNNTVLYVGMTTNLRRRTYQHKTGFYDGFTKRYNCHKLVYFEEFTHIVEAIKREKQLKAGNRKRKIALIEQENKEWKDLSEGWVFDF